MSQLVLSLFPGGGLLDHAFALEGFTVVRGPDPLWGGDIRQFHPPAGKFDGIIGGDPCQSHSSLANLTRARGLEPSFPDLTPEYERVVNEARPTWFLRENVPQAPDIKPDGYDVRSFMLCNSTLDDGTGWGNEQMRKRRFWFGVRDGECPELRRWIDFALFELPPALSGSGKRKATAVGSSDGRKTETPRKGSKDRAAWEAARCSKAAPVTGRHEGAVGAPGVDYSPPRRTLEEMMHLQGMPEDWFKHSPFTMQGKRKIVGNGVAIPMGRTIARAVLAAMEEN